MLKKYTDKIFCFSPPVMLATFIIEFSLAAYTYWRYKANKTTKITIAILLALGIFQLSEYMLCGGLGISGVEWARLGYASITLLPAMGIHLLVTLAGKHKPMLVKLAYATCAFFVCFYLIVSNSIDIKTCQDNYAVFLTAKPISTFFGIYYYFWLFVGACLGLKWGKEDAERSKSLYAMTIGYMVFILPTTTVNIVDPSTVSGIPSIMCGFAILFALTLSFFVLPNSSSKEKRRKI